MQTLHQLIPGSRQKPITLDVTYKNNSLAKPLVIFVHGFKGFKDWGHFNLVAQKFAEEDFVFLKFNFSHNGTTPQQLNDFADLEAFGNNNYLIELNDLQLVIDWALNNTTLSKQINPQQVYLIGHSRGGGVSILKAGEDQRITKVVAWASVSSLLNRNKQNTIDAWKEVGVVFTFNARTKQQMPLYYQFYEVMEANKHRLDVLKSAAHLNIPLLIVHGTNDEAVPHSEAEELHRAAANSELFLVEESGHTFEAKHPFEGDTLPQNAQRVFEKTLAFLKQ